MTVVVGTAGHIDHGKTTLLRALTGIDADRLPEEQRRGMTIDVGYAHLALPDGKVLDFVDVPGHDRLVGNMLVGAGEIDAALLVVAADDGPRAQTIEHLELLDALGIDAGIAVVTKTDVAGAERAGEVIDQVARLLARTTLAGSPIVAVSPTTGVGLDALRAALLALQGRVLARTAVDAAPARLAIDRAFTVRGRGVVVTGTLRGGQIARGDELRLVPGDRTVVVREVQVHGTTIDAAGPGRAALNLRGLGAGDLHRGMVLTRDEAVGASDRVLVTLRPPASLRDGVRSLPADGERLRIHAGTEQVDARVGRAGREAVALHGDGITALIRLAAPIALAPGDRFVLRRPSVGAAAAAGRVLDVEPPRGISRRRATPGRLAALAASGGAASERLAPHGAVGEGATIALAPDVRATIRAAAVELVAHAHRATPDAPGVPLAELRPALARTVRAAVTASPRAALAAASAILDELVAERRLVRAGDAVHDPDHAPVTASSADDAAIERLVASLDVAAPPPLSEAARRAGCGPDAVRRAEREQRIVRLDTDLAWATTAWERLAAIALDEAGGRPLTPAAFRDLTGTSRKYVMALIEDFDRRGILARTAAGHVPGPRAATLRRPERVS